MFKRVSIMLAAFSLLVLLPLMASAQQHELPTFTMVSEWAIPRAQWADYVAFAEKNAKPIFDKMMADGTITGYGMYMTIVHDESGITHGNWYEANSIAAIEKVLGELLKLPPSPIISAGVKHRDYMLRSSLRRAKAASGTNGYLWVNYTQLQPGKAQEWRGLFDRYIKPVFEDQMAKGNLLLYEIEGEHVHTDNPGGVFIVYVTPSADAMDKFFAAVLSVISSNPLLADAIAAVTVPAAHRDYFGRVLHYAQK